MHHSTLFVAIPLRTPVAENMKQCIRRAKAKYEALVLQGPQGQHLFVPSRVREVVLPSSYSGISVFSAMLSAGQGWYLEDSIPTTVFLKAHPVEPGVELKVATLADPRYPDRRACFGCISATQALEYYEDDADGDLDTGCITEYDIFTLRYSLKLAADLPEHPGLALFGITQDRKSIFRLASRPRELTAASVEAYLDTCPAHFRTGGHYEKLASALRDRVRFYEERKADRRLEEAVAAARR